MLGSAGAGVLLVVGCTRGRTTRIAIAVPPTPSAIKPARRARISGSGEFGFGGLVATDAMKAPFVGTPVGAAPALRRVSTTGVAEGADAGVKAGLCVAVG